ncbi:MAG: hypothetical protein ACUVQ4_09885 [bacterium]
MIAIVVESFYGLASIPVFVHYFYKNGFSGIWKVKNGKQWF